MANIEGAGTPIRLLIVEDDPDMRRTIADYLEREGMLVSLASSGKEMVRHLDNKSFAMIILDLRLGQEDGLDLLRDLRAKTDVPVIITTGHRREEVDRVLGLELGADDYILKPFSLRELLARVRTVLRRRKPPEDGKPSKAPRWTRFEGWSLDRRARRLTDPAGQEMPLTKGEYSLLVAFVDAPGRILSREFLLHATRVHEDVFDRSIDVQILRLRRKIEADPNAPRFIKTERGQGYVFSVPTETA